LIHISCVANLAICQFASVYKQGYWFKCDITKGIIVFARCGNNHINAVDKIFDGVEKSCILDIYWWLNCRIVG